MVATEAAQRWELSFALDLPPLLARGRWRDGGSARKCAVTAADSYGFGPVRPAGLSGRQQAASIVVNPRLAQPPSCRYTERRRSVLARWQSSPGRATPRNPNAERFDSPNEHSGPRPFLGSS